MKEISTLEELQSLIEQSSDSPLFIFKHSTACPTSARAHRRVQSFIEGAHESSPEIYMVKVIQARNVSNAIEQQLNLPHQSPQLLLIAGKQAVWSTSHHLIAEDAITQAIAQHLSPTA